jgi:hypothetical protein
MSVRQVLDTVESLLKDPDQGLAATIEALALEVEGDEAGGPWTMDVQTDDLLLEFIPTINNESATKIGTPTLLPMRTGYAFDPGDTIVLDRPTFDRVVNEGASGFTLMIAARLAALVGSDYSAFVYVNAAGDGAVYLAFVQGSGNVRVSTSVSYNPSNYEHAFDAGNIAFGPRVIALRYDRTSAPGSRLKVYVDGIAAAGGSAGIDNAADPEAIAGLIDTYPAGTVKLGASEWGAPNTPLGAVWGWKAALDPAAIALASQRAAAHYAVEG